MIDKLAAAALMFLPLGGLLAVWWQGGALAPLRWGMLALAVLLLVWFTLFTDGMDQIIGDPKQVTTAASLIAVIVILWIWPNRTVIWVLFALSTALISAVSGYLAFVKMSRLF